MNENKNKKKKRYPGPKIIIFSAIIAIISFFFPWGKDLEYNEYLFSYEVYPPVFWYIVFFAYPVYKVYSGNFMNKFVAIIIAVNGIFFALLFIFGSTNEELVVSFGPFIYITAVVILIYGIIRFPKKER
jgi:hypothetical protein